MTGELRALLLLASALLLCSCANGKTRVQEVSGWLSSNDAVFVTVFCVKNGSESREETELRVRAQYSLVAQVRERRYVQVSSNGRTGGYYRDLIEFRYNHDKQASFTYQSIRAVLDAARNTWNIVPWSSLVIAISGSTEVCPSLSNKDCIEPGGETGAFADGNNTIGWGDLEDANTLGLTFQIFASEDECTHCTIEVDIMLNTRAAFSISDSTPKDFFDLQSIALHEFGHALGLSHTPTPSAVMFASIQSGSQKRALAEDDVLGVTCLYPRTSTSCTEATVGSTQTTPTTATPPTKDSKSTADMITETVAITFSVVILLIFVAVGVIYAKSRTGKNERDDQNPVLSVEW